MEGGRAFPLPPGWKAGTWMSGRMGRRGATAFDSVTAPLLSSMDRTRRSESRRGGADVDLQDHYHDSGRYSRTTGKGDLGGASEAEGEEAQTQGGQGQIGKDVSNLGAWRPRKVRFLPL